MTQSYRLLAAVYAPISDEEFTPYECMHSGVAGMMYVHDEDLDIVAAQRAANGAGPIECGKCDAVYRDGAWMVP
jgi:hypothetical protein